MKSFWVRIELHDAVPINEQNVQNACTRIQELVPEVKKVTPADPDTYEGE